MRGLYFDNATKLIHRSYATTVYAAKPKADTNIVSTKKADATMRDNTARLVDRGPVTGVRTTAFPTL